ncbi:hypothetical protein GALMADRAFT_207930 [Galerina marginata CBS 339.88]|uniref:Retrotransposon gag domain-containing protein n=1 Tax=Galerina marginata (strain CBS 339.88) TaxID=685588 RepID=A0A067TMB6_GALM3|nr:hypothetical protein GALMADRAFT_207930 [Galerina marginata CBS 339.88]
MNNNEKALYCRRLQATAEADVHTENRAPTPGPSNLKDKGKGVDLRGQEIPGVPQEELEPEYQKAVELGIRDQARRATETETRAEPNDEPEVFKRAQADELAEELAAQEQAGDSDSVTSSRRARKRRAQKKHGDECRAGEADAFTRIAVLEAENAQLRRSQSEAFRRSVPVPNVHASTDPGLAWDTLNRPQTNNYAGVRGHSQAVAQVPEDSYLGRLLNEVGDLDSGPSDSSSSSSSSAGSRRRQSSNGSRSRGRGRRSRHKKQKRAAHKELAKPVKPEKYNGSEKIQEFTRFVHECKDYIQTAWIKPRRQVLVVSRFLEGKAITFYLLRVAKDSKNWTLKDFFSALFNDIFSRSYRMGIRDCIVDYTQGSRTSHRTMARKLWEGLRLSIRQKLYDYDFSPEINTWDEIVYKAETIEVGELEANREAAQDKRLERNRDANKRPNKSDQQSNTQLGGPSDRFRFVVDTRL